MTSRICTFVRASAHWRSLSSSSFLAYTPHTTLPPVLSSPPPRAGDMMRDYDGAAGDMMRDYDGAYLQMRLGFSPLAPLVLFLVRWTDCSLAGALGLLRVLVFKVHKSGRTTAARHERKASLSEFYGKWGV
ncbi:unnamed protein product [Closterium sp. Naga37s-1]|nr:unnamed protein product [Closterium sp. Naga37s-1]